MNSRAGQRLQAFVKHAVAVGEEGGIEESGGWRVEGVEWRVESGEVTGTVMP